MYTNIGNRSNKVIRQLNTDTAYLYEGKIKYKLNEVLTATKSIQAQIETTRILPPLTFLII